MSVSQLPTEKIDHELLYCLHKLIHEEYYYLSPNERGAQKKLFYDTDKVDFTYPEAQKISLPIYHTELLEIQQNISTVNAPLVVKELYQAKFAEQQKIIDILEATTNRDDHAFHAASCDLYGTPDPKLFWFTVKSLNANFKSLISKVDPKRKTLHRAYNEWKQFVESLKQPENIGVYHVPMYDGIYIPNDYEIDSAEKIHQVFTDYLDKNNINNWVVRIDFPGARTSFGVNQTTKVINIPHDSDLQLRKKTLTKVTLQALLMHEVGVHVVRRENGDASPLALLGVGLDNYLKAEEGIATLAEQLITGTNHYAGEIGYLSVGAAMGILGNPLSFADLFKMLNAYYILSIADKQLTNDGFYELEELRITASDQAWNSTLRVYRGTTGNTTGAVYTRDIIYLDGNKRMWNLLGSENEINPEWLVGKYDPANPIHVSALKELGILGG